MLVLLGLYLFTDAEEPGEHFLVGEAVQGACQAIQASREGEVGVRQGTAH